MEQKKMTQRQSYLIIMGVGAFFGLCAGLTCAGEAGKIATQRAREMPLETTCNGLSERPLEVRGLDGNVYRIVCDEYGVPAPQDVESVNLRTQPSWRWQ